MGTPVPDVASQVAQELVSPPLRDAFQPKTGESKFDAVLLEKTGGPTGSSETMTAGAVEKVGQAELSRPSEKPGASPLSSALTKMMGDIERGQGVMERLINGGLFSTKQISNTQLLALQAGMYKYTQELELTGKVVEKATTGLKDTLKTQV